MDTALLSSIVAQVSTLLALQSLEKKSYDVKPCVSTHINRSEPCWLFNTLEAETDSRL